MTEEDKDNEDEVSPLEPHLQEGIKKLESYATKKTATQGFFNVALVSCTFPFYSRTENYVSFLYLFADNKRCKAHQRYLDWIWQTKWPAGCPIGACCHQPYHWGNGLSDEMIDLRWYEWSFRWLLDFWCSILHANPSTSPQKSVKNGTARRKLMVKVNFSKWTSEYSLHSEITHGPNFLQMLLRG